MKRSALISRDGRYRYRLTRTWDVEGETLVWVMLNPSTADATVDDATIRRCIDFSRRWGYGGMEVVNLFALRATDPRELRAWHDPKGPRNHQFIWASCRNRDVVLAYGANAIVSREVEYVANTVFNIETQARKVMCLGLTKDGHPVHPLRQAARTKPMTLGGRT